MAEWIKLEHVTPDKPEISLLADRLEIDLDAAFGKCVRFWIWLDQQAVNGNHFTVTKTLLDRITNCPGFTEGLESVGWLKAVDGGFAIPNADRHNGKTSKNRALTREKVRAHREKKRNREEVTTSPSPSPSQDVEVEGGRGAGEGGLDDVPPKRPSLPDVVNPTTPVEWWLQMFRDSRPSHGHPLQGMAPADVADAIGRVEDEIAARGSIGAALTLLGDVLDESPKPTSVKQAVFFCQRKAEANRKNGKVDDGLAQRLAEQKLEMKRQGKI